MVDTPSPEVIETDVLVVGGALTGMYAAIRAREAGLKVLVVDKATAGKSGCVAFAGGDISLVNPEDDFDALMERYVSNGDGLVDQDWLEFALRETSDRVRELESWGVPFERDESGAFARHAGRGGGALAVVFPGYKLLDQVKRVCRAKGVQFVNKVMVNDIVTRDGIACGAIGFSVETAATYLFKAKAIVLVPGPCSFKATYIGHRMCAGDGIAAAYRHGAEVMSMEFAVGHNTGPRHYDISGLARFVAMGGKFVNAQGEAFMERYDRVLKDKTNWSVLNRAMALEVRAGRGPLYFDLTSISPDNFELSRRIIPHTFRTLDRAGLDLRKDRIEWIACFQGNQGGPAGLVIRRDFSTTIPGLFTGGDTGAHPWYGAQAGYHGINLAWCCISGHHSGLAAARYAREVMPADPEKEVLQEATVNTTAPLKRKAGKTPDEVILAIQETLIPYDVVILKHQDRLQKALEKVLELREDAERNIHASDGHELMKAHEAASMALIAEMILRASLVRTESRGTHFREDFPQRDDRNWLQVLHLRRERDKMKLWTVPVPQGPYRVREE